MSKSKYVVVEYYESDHGGKPGDESNVLAIHRLENGELEAAEDGAPTSKEEALEMLEAFNRPIYTSVDVAEEESSPSNVMEYAGDGDVSTDTEFLKAKSEAELKMASMPMNSILNSVPSGNPILLESSSTNKVSWHMKIIGVRVDGSKHLEEFVKLGINNIMKPRIWVECYIYEARDSKPMSFVGCCLVGRDI